MLNFPKDKTEEITIISGELTDNLISHSKRGTITLSYEEYEDNSVIEITSYNEGQQLPIHAFKDGFSSKSSLGIGLGAIKRFSDKLIVERRDNVNIIKSFIYKYPISHKLYLSIMTQAILGYETENGDNAIVIPQFHRDLLCVIDALGHGKDACKSALKSIEYIENNNHLDLDNIIMGVHNTLYNLRGISIFLVSLNYKFKEICSSGIGDVTTKIYYPNDEKPFYPLAQDGIVGENIRKTTITKSPLYKDAIIVMFSDGISRTLDIQSQNKYDDVYEILCTKWSTYYKKSDDATLLIAKIY